MDKGRRAKQLRIDWVWYEKRGNGSIFVIHVNCCNVFFNFNGLKVFLTFILFFVNLIWILVKKNKEFIFILETCFEKYLEFSINLHEKQGQDVHTALFMCNQLLENSSHVWDLYRSGASKYLMLLTHSLKSWATMMRYFQGKFLKFYFYAPHKGHHIYRQLYWIEVNYLKTY